ncbi:MAG: SAM-dependent methyltransferase [Pseudomonadota bacterium]
MKHIRQIIEEKGSITIAQFMELAMYDLHNGYYITSDPIGKNGDFITAPEISQLFGEMIGVYCASVWEKLRKPKEFNLVELGPGRATLMLDLIRATKNLKEFTNGMNIHLVETNEKLIHLQKEKLANYPVTWHKDVMSLPDDLPLIIVANEFFDCLPINQYIKDQNIWHEQAVSIIPKSEEFCLIKTPILSHFGASLNREHPNSKQGAILEVSYPAINIIQTISNILCKVPGYLLAIDYGYDIDPLSRNSYNSSLQAVKDHKFHPMFSDIGRADLTSHVDFLALRQTAKAHFCKASETISQREFLNYQGINLRADILKKKATIQQAIEIDEGLDRLINPKYMGNLFKVVEISNLNS